MTKPTDTTTIELLGGITSGKINGTFRDLIQVLRDMGPAVSAAGLEADLRGAGMPSAAIDHMQVTFEPDGVIQLSAPEPDQTPRIFDVINWSNGMTAAFDQFGNQMPDYQGRTEEVMSKIRAAGFEYEPRTLDWSRDVLGGRG